MPVNWRAQGNLTNPGLVKPRETKDKACSEPTLRILSDVLLQKVADSLPLVPVITKHKSLHGAYNRHLQMVGQPTVPSHTAETWKQLTPPVAAMERSKVTCSIQVCWRKLGPYQEGLLWPSHEVHSIAWWLGSYFSFSSLMLLFHTDDLLTFEMVLNIL